MAELKRLPIIYDIPKKIQIVNAFHERNGKFDNPYNEFADMCLSNLTWAAYHLLMWQGEPLRLAPFQSVILDTLWNKTFPLFLASRGAGKTFLLAVYATLVAMLKPGSKIIIVSSSFRQSKFVFEYIESLYKYSPILRACCPKNGVEKPPDQVLLRIGDSVIRALPLGNGEKIRGMRATNILVDEFASVNPEVFQVVVRGFASVSASPIKAALKLHEERRAVAEGRMDASEIELGEGNQIIYSGTANYQFNHFYKVYLTHKAIIESKICGDAKQVNSELNLYDEDALSEGYLDYRDYAIIQLPYQGLPEGYMDERQIAQAKITMPRALFQMEYECKFPTDSDGFYKRSVINTATPGHPTSNGGAPFSVEIKGIPGYQYVMGIDPARKTDNFSISILKLNNESQTYKNVYCFSMNKKKWPEATRKVRELLDNFNIVRIAMDAGGGGTTVMDLLQDETFLQPGERKILRIDNDEDRPIEGEHILEMVDFSSTWIRNANYDMVSDFEHCRLLFPYRSLSLVAKEFDEFEQAREDIWEEIDEQIKETCMIVVTPTKTGVEHFDIPELPASQQSTLKKHPRKDRYSALLLSSYAARSYFQEGQRNIEPALGGWI